MVMSVSRPILFIIELAESNTTEELFFLVDIACPFREFRTNFKSFKICYLYEMNYTNTVYSVFFEIYL